MIGKGERWDRRVGLGKDLLWKCGEVRSEDFRFLKRLLIAVRNAS